MHVHVDTQADGWTYSTIHTDGHTHTCMHTYILTDRQTDKRADFVVIISWSLSSSSSRHPSGDFSVWDYRSLTLFLWPSASFLDSVIIISWSSLDSDVIISFDLLTLYLAVDSSLLFVVLLDMYLCNLLL